MLDARSFHDPNPPTPAFSETHDWIKYYLVQHRLSRMSRALYPLNEGSHTDVALIKLPAIVMRTYSGFS